MQDMLSVHACNQEYMYINVLLVQLRGLVQSPCEKINIIMTLTFYPPPPLS